MYLYFLQLYTGQLVIDASNEILMRSGGVAKRSRREAERRESGLMILIIDLWVTCAWPNRLCTFDVPNEWIFHSMR